MAGTISFLKDTRSPGRVHALRDKLDKKREEERDGDDKADDGEPGPDEEVQKEFYWEEVLGALDKAGKFTTLMTYTPIRWLSLFACVERMVGAWDPVMSTLTTPTVYAASSESVQLKAKYLAAELQELRGTFLFLADMAPVWQRPMQDLQTTNDPIAHRAFWILHGLV